MKLQKNKWSLDIRNMTPMETLEECCYWVSTKILEDAKKWNKRPEDALRHNFERVISQMKNMDLIKKES